MGLDWQPLEKPKPGFEDEFEKIYRHLYDNVPVEVPVRKKWGMFRDRDRERAERHAAEKAMTDRLEVIGVRPWETIGAPCVGRDQAGDEWVLQRYETRKNKDLTPEQFLENMRGYYVVDLAPDSDGKPVYSNAPIASYCEAYTFRGQFLDSVREWLGNPVVDDAWRNYRAPELVAYGERLRDGALQYARAQSIPVEILEARAGPEDLDAPPGQAHIVMSAARWCQWWGERGHGMIAWY